MEIRSIMTANPKVCTPQTPLRDVARMMLDCDCGEIPVVADLESKKPVGVVTDRDIVIRLVAHGQNPVLTAAGECMTAPAVTLSADATVEDCAHLMAEHQIRRIPIVDDKGCICGIVALADLERTKARSLKSEVTSRVSVPH
ncbi:CBS domain-containing protein [Tahibacter amnicola]|uniref:CBS domain-containing protein n=1 Tax=Tahibacter amnicola TaxID=2976241 RepID=A0ABY6BMQ3_9GAMM|nr:CBS domain-containing protein [Tahibacter amnicola]UXI69851.1 CBS domain-containing protein [Tahibacter amnicola]